MAPTRDDEEALASVQSVLDLLRTEGILGGMDAAASRQLTLLIRQLIPLIPELAPGIGHTGQRNGVWLLPERSAWSAVAVLPIPIDNDGHCCCAGELFLRALIRRTAQRLAEPSSQNGTSGAFQPAQPMEPRATLAAVPTVAMRSL